ncbi:flavin-dependent oxidoreductase [Thalassobaculum sp. OXR-137]|uniref:flavin-dependent oxidoreductase n=1 Tax=Thalassobaculum sp. OXR-137 TaxID=3100173 RepID=UPI002AC9AC3D|nr:flavin-dependent oxidoreductase [Thalassobaculum sp. OXR-137]WPZ35706.1 flavin-dependent oxidoreductase [Thalassobaculum sp. OXR-137]
MTVLIAGGGIGGLTLALSLHQVDIRCRLFEAVETLAPLGVGINVLPHAVRELTELGLQEELLGLGIPTARLAYYSRRGQEIWSEPRGRDAGYGWPQISIHRGELQMLLTRTVLQRLGADTIATGHVLTAWEDRGDRIVARFADRNGAEIAEVEGDVLIAADGIHSTARAALHPDEGPPIWNGAILWRGTAVSQPFLGGRTMIMAGHEYQKFVCYPLRDLPDGRQLINLIAERKFSADQPWRREDWNRAGRVEDYLPPFETWRFDWLDVPGLIRAAEKVYEYPMVDRDPLDAWSHGRLTLLGDAAHPMYPIGSNGASQAILDARVLTRELLAKGLTPAALQAYEAERLPATAKIVTANRGNGPEQVMQMVEERAPNGFERIDDVLSAEEREGTAAAYKRLAGFDKDALNARPPIVPEAAA